MADSLSSNASTASTADEDSNKVNGVDNKAFIKDDIDAESRSNGSGSGSSSGKKSPDQGGSYSTN
jgi:hypothetical protein